MYRRHLSINQNWITWPDKIQDVRVKEGVQTFLFIDDFLGTGEQFKRFVESYSMGRVFDDVYAVYAPLVAHQNGIDYLRMLFPNLRVRAVEVLDDKYNLFSDNSIWFQDQDGTNTPSSARLFYEELVRNRKLPIGSNNLTGFGNFAIAYSFEHATPDNCLPILWLRTKSWNPLFER